MWSDMTACALVNGTGILAYSLCNKCASTIVIRDKKYRSKFCTGCEKRTFAMKYPFHAQKHPLTFFDVKTNDEGKFVDQGESTWKSMVPCAVNGRGAIVTVILAACCRPSITVENEELTFNFCTHCQQKTTWGKFPKSAAHCTAVCCRPQVDTATSEK